MRKTLAGAAVVVMATASLTSVTRVALAAEAPSAFNAVAAADAFRITLAAPGISVVNTLADVAAPTAQAAINGVGASTGYAALPDPGELVLTGPGLIAGATAGPTGGALSFPPYPLAAQTMAPHTPEAKTEAGPYLVSARSTSQESAALARSGTAEPSAALTQSTARAALDQSTTIADATSIGRGITVGPLSIGAFTARSTASIVPGQLPKLTTDFQLHGVSVNGTAIGVTPAGLVVAGTTSPLPPRDPVRAALAQSGLDVQYVVGSTSGGTARSAALRITLRHVFTDGVPGAIPAGQVVEYRLMLGQVMASVGASASDDVTVDDFLSVPLLDDVFTEARVAVDELTATGVDSFGLDLRPGAANGVLDVAARPAAAADRGLPIDSFNFYWVLVVGAAATTAAVQLNRTAARRRSWLAVVDHPPTGAEGGSS